MSPIRSGLENDRQPVCPAGHVSVSPVKVVVSSAEFCVLVTPADCGHDVVPEALVQTPAGALAEGVPMLLVSTPEVASESLWAMVLLMIFTLNASCKEIPAPSHPATLLTMMLLVMVTSCHSAGVLGKVDTSVPLTAWSRMPPPLPLSAEFRSEEHTSELQ